MLELILLGMIKLIACASCRIHVWHWNTFLDVLSNDQCLTSSAKLYSQDSNVRVGSRLASFHTALSTGIGVNDENVGDLTELLARRC